MKKSVRQGFTLVELLIVIVIIGILSAMMMLSSTEAVSSARAADIISDLRNLKTAALAWYADNLDYVEGGNKPGSSTKFATSKLNGETADILKYLGNEGLKSSYSFSNGEKAGTWFVWCEVKDSKVAEKLKSRAKSVGLCQAANGTSDGATQSGDITVNTSGSTFVGMFIR